LSGTGTTISVNTTAGKSFRMTGLTIDVALSAAVYGAINFNGASTAVRFDHNHVNDTTGGDHTLQPDTVNGVIDHNFFDSTNQSNLFFIQPTTNGPDGEANATWTVPENFGTSAFLFVESNFFQNGAFLFDCDFGGRIVFRYNTGWYNTRIQTHGVGSGAQRRGRRTMEVYGNTFTYSASPNSNSFAFLVDYESGTAMWWGNTITAFSTFLREDEIRSNSATYTQSATPGGWGYCGKGASGTGSNWDQNGNGTTGYACLDQIGRGAGQLLTGSLPSLVNQNTGTIAWPNQALVPVYAWNNTLNTNSYGPQHYWANYESPATAAENRDYYLQLPNIDEAATFNGTAGVGSGLLSTRPSICTPMVAYWATDTSTLYQCTAANTWTAYYTPYTYPHPLDTTGVSDTQPPTVPLSLTASAVSSSAINLSWTASTDNVGVTGYTVFRGGAQIGTSGTNSYSDTGLTASTQYIYTVNAFDAAGNKSAQSTSASATTAAQTVDTQPPTVPQSLTASAVSSGINLSWTASTDNVAVTGYTIYRGGVQVGTSATNSYSNSGLAASTQYTYTVSAFDAAGNQSAQSTSASATTSALTAGGAPTLVQHVATGMDETPVTSLKVTLPNPAGAGNALILGIQFHSSGSVSSVADNQGNTWVAGPTATGSSQRMSLYYALNVAGGTQTITIAFGGLGSANGYPQAVVSEFYNVAQVSAADGSSGSATSRTAGAIATTAAGDLIYHWGVDFSDTNGNGGAYNGGSIAAGAGFTLLSADLQVGSADQYQVQSSAGSISPTFTASGAATWGSLALAFKSASAGTPPPPGIRIVHIQHTVLAETRVQGRSTPVVMQFPSSGNLLVGLLNSPDYLVTGISDSGNNTWVSAASTPGGGGNTGAQIVYAANAATSPTLSRITVTLGGTTAGGVMFNLYDITGSAASPFDKATTALGDQTSTGNLTTASLTPSTANGLVLNDTAIDFHTLNGIVGSGYVLDSVVNASDNDAAGTNGTPDSTLDEDNGFAHIYNTSASPITFVYTATATGTPSGILNWGSVSAAFIAAAGGSAPASPTALTVTVH
jgi:chitodextrinase